MEEQRGSLGLRGSGPQQSCWEWLLEGFGQMDLVELLADLRGQMEVALPWCAGHS